MDGPSKITKITSIKVGASGEAFFDPSLVIVEPGVG